MSEQINIKLPKKGKSLKTAEKNLVELTTEANEYILNSLLIFKALQIA